MMQWMLPKRASKCLMCAQGFIPSQEYVSIIKGEGQREDFCLQCWSKITPQGTYWKGRVPVPIKYTDIPSNRVLIAWELFKHNSTLTPEEKYVLALFLVRCKKLRMREEISKENQVHQLFEDPQADDMYLIPKPLLKDMEISLLQKSLLDKFAHATSS